MNLLADIEAAIGSEISDVAPLSGGCVGQVYQIVLKSGQRLVAKADEGPVPRLDTEGYMLRYLASHSLLPVPEVLFSSDKLLLMEFLPGNSRFSSGAQEDAAELLAALHGISAAAYGLERDTLIGGLRQPNGWNDCWLDFFRERRLRYMAKEAHRSGRLPAPLLFRLNRLCDRLDEWLDEPEQPSLIHGDVWTTNVLALGERVTGFIDPAIYYAHPEIELAFATLFGTFGDAFFVRYQELRPISSGFFEERRDLYNLYPLLVHVRLFGGSYVHSVESSLQKFGF